MKNREVNELTRFQADSIAQWDYDTDQIKLIEAKNEISQAALDRFISRNGNPVEVHRTNGRRVFNPFTAMKRTHRKYVSYRGDQLIEVDAKNSHPLIMVHKMLQEGLSVEQDLKIAVESGTFYDYLMDGIKTRDQIKESWFSFCYDKKVNTSHPVYNKLNNLFPKFIESFTKYAEGRSLSEYLQELESRIWIDKVSMALMRAGIYHATIHDSVVFAGVQHLNKVMDIIQASFGKIDPPLHVDYLGGSAVEYRRIPNPANAKYLSPDFKLLDELHECEADPWINIDTPKTAVSVIDGEDEIPMFTLGNFSAISGKSKSGKTLLISGIVAAALNGETVLNKFKGGLPVDKCNIVYIDTEMADYDFQWVMRRILKLSEANTTAKIKFYRLREKNTAKRIELIDAAIRTTEKLGLVIIDGIRDIVNDINNSEESTIAMNYLLKWTDVYKIHLLTVLHQNPGKETGNKLRGHIGTEVMNKAESVISVIKDTNAEHSNVTSDFMRRASFTTFGLVYNKETNMPEIVGGTEPVNAMIKEADEIEAADYVEAVQKMFESTDSYSKTRFTEVLKQLLLLKQYAITKRVMPKIIKYMMEGELIIEENAGKNSKQIKLFRQ